MSNTIWFITYQLKKDKSEQDFLLASAKCHDEVLSKQKGFISWEVLRDGDTWVDVVKWENGEDAKNAETAGAGNPAARDFYAYINMSTCKQTLYSVEKTHRRA